jgi:hypothetical protein
MPKQVKLKAELRVTYTPNGMTTAELKALLDGNLSHAIGSGLLSGHSSAEVEGYSIRIIENGP